MATTTSLPITFPGPPVHARATTATVFTIAQLHAFPYLSAIPRVINTAYRTSHAVNPHLEMSLDDRVPGVASFFSQMRADPATFTLVLTYATSDSSDDDNDRVLATATGRRHFGLVPGKPFSPWDRPFAPPEGVLEWEMKLLAVDPRVQKQGLAGWLLEVMEREIKERSAAMGGEGKVKVILTTAQEINEAFYKKRGYVLDVALAPREDAKFHVAHMSKEL